MKQLNSPWTQTNAAIKIIQLGTTVLTGLIAGTVFGIWIGFNPENLSATAYVEQQQGTIGALNVLMPILGLLSIALTFCYAYSVRNNTRSLYMLTISILFLHRLKLHKEHIYAYHLLFIPNFLCLGHPFWKSTAQCYSNHLEFGQHTRLMGANQGSVVEISCFEDDQYVD